MAINKSYTFSNNTIADPAEVNQNFDDLIAAIRAAHHRDGDGTKISYQDIASGWGLIPAGGVILWNGLISAIPTGYVFCNGANSTQDMRNKFVIGAGQDSGGTYDTFDVAGASTINLYHRHAGGSHVLSYNEMAYHNHGDNGHGHSAWTDSQGAHSHEYRSGGGTTAEGYAANTNVDEHRQNTESAGAHGHGVGIGTGYASIAYAGGNWAHDHGVGDYQLSASQSIIPPFIAMVWIQKT